MQGSLGTLRRVERRYPLHANESLILGTPNIPVEMGQKGENA
jgi:hypothetical protein